MAPRRSMLLALPVLAVSACSAPEPGARTAEGRAPIIGGADDRFRSYVVGVGTPYDPMNPSDPNGGPFCSGVLISRRTVLTAGHCYSAGVGPQGGITAVFFGPDITSPLPSSAGVVGTVQAARHPGFDPATLSNDLALVELAADAPTQSAPLLRETMTSTPDFVGPPLAFAGFGNDGEQNYGIRRVAVFPIDAVGPACVGLDTGTGPIDATEFYYRAAGKNTCAGDSGGPAFLRRDHVERVAGVTSAGDQACIHDGDDARSDAPQIAAFIQATIDRFEDMDPCRADGACDEACNTANLLADPDCAPAHCGADGICVISCVDPPDPDCPAIDHCDLDGVCDPGCSPLDLDCLPPPDGGASGTGSTDGGDSSMGGADGGDCVGGGAGTGVSGDASAGEADAGVDVPIVPSRGCVYVADGADGESRLSWVLGLGAIVAVRRRRRDV